jgi:hypothetical protein
MDPQAWLADLLARLPDYPLSASTNFCLGFGTVGASRLKLLSGTCVIRPKLAYGPDRMLTPSHNEDKI